MNCFWKHIYVFCLFLGMGQSLVIAQEIEPKQEVNIDDLGDVSDKFQEFFFEALKQKAITNYDKAIVALNKCVEIDPQANFLYSELAKNYLELKLYQQAEDNFKKVLTNNPNDRYVLELLFECYFKQNKLDESIEVVEKLVIFNPMFKEQLANLYYHQKRYDEALTALDELDNEFGADAYRNRLRKTISAKIINPNNQIKSLEDKIKKHPKVEQHYLNLIYHYSKDNRKQKAYQTAQALLKEKPKSELVHMALYKFYLDDNKIDEAISSMKITLKSRKIDAESKYKVITDFLNFTEKNPQFEERLKEIVSLLSSEQNNVKVFTELGHYYYKKNYKEQALNYYERGIQSNVNDFTLLKKILLLQIDLKRFDKAEAGSELALELYPAQPIFYWVNGFSLIHLEKAQQAIEILTIGIDYVIDDIKMESDFYKQISQAYQQLGDTENASKYQQKVEQLQKKS
ncbi:tetratricopeptide repeat protein [Aquimarina sp. 2201CG1-2-11]|uniref:tetratricopeptide repeat protein n=1 Tax=Aquimarina discodermiae TaxID=3231043 RepID=UPI003461F8C5